MNIVEVTQGDSPIILGQPHGGTHVPDAIFARLNENGQRLADTDWHIGQLYDGLLEGATVVASNIHRYVIDANRDPAGASLYPGQNTTTLVPLTDFDGQAIWRSGQEPTPEEVAERRALYHAPYHAALAAEIERVKARHGVAILYDCHSIRSDIPFLFSGQLPVFSIGTNMGATCDPAVEAAAKEITLSDEGYDVVINGRFKGGWTTRNYGRPARNEHAIQMELAQRSYMEEATPWTYRPDRAEVLRPHLRKLLKSLNDLALSGALSDEQSGAQQR